MVIKNVPLKRQRKILKTWTKHAYCTITLLQMLLQMYFMPTNYDKRYFGAGVGGNGKGLFLLI
jgi:hypothetical protein